MHRFIAAVVGLIVVFFTSRVAVGGDIFVDDSHTSGTFDGEDWDTCFQYLQDAIDIATSGDVIHVAQGSYYPDLDGGFNAPSHTLGSRSETFSMKSDVILLGGYIGFDDGSPNTRDPSLYPTVLSGDIGTIDVASDNSYHVVTAEGVNDGAVLNGFHVVAGYASGSSTNRYGAGIYITGSESSPHILNCIITGNAAPNPAAGRGGGVYFGAASGEPLFDHCDFLNNEAGVRGAAAFVHTPNTATFNVCAFSNNATTGAESVIGYGAGALYLEKGAFDLTDCTFTQNTVASGNGGAIHGFGATLTLRRCDFTQNEAHTQGQGRGQGGAIYLTRAATTEIIECKFTGNVSEANHSFSGGAIAIIREDIFEPINTGPVFVVNSQFFSNAVGEGFYGGGILAEAIGSGLEITNCLFVDNVAGRGGAALVHGSGGSQLVTFTNCTIADNHATGDVGGVIFETADTGEVHNTILWGNTDDDGGTDTRQEQLNWGSGTAPVVTFSCIQDDDPDDANIPFGGGSPNYNIDDDPLFVDATPEEVELRDYRLQPCSPASDAAYYDVIPADAYDINDDDDLTEKTPDLDRMARAFDNAFRDNDGAGDYQYTDMGAYELTFACTDLGDMQPDEALDGLDVQPFVLCLLEEPGDCVCADADLDGAVTLDDIPCFVMLLLTGESCIADCDVGQRSFPDCNNNGIHDVNDIDGGASDDCNENGVPDECDIAEETSADVNTNGVPDECEDDCNTNGIPDEKDIADETSADVNTNGMPDECESDCNTNGIPDDWDIAEATSADCNENGVPDECEQDCNTNGVPDDCDVDPTDPDGDEWVSPDCNADGYPDECNMSLPPPFGSLDCNTNGVPDECDIADCENDTACDDCNENGIPDGCDIAAEISADCNENGVPDECDIASETSEDVNTNGIPDECEGESMMGGGGGESSMMSGGGESEPGAQATGDEGSESESESEYQPGAQATGDANTAEGGCAPSEDAAWEEFYEWSSAQCWGPNCETTTDAQFDALVAKLRELDLPVEARR